MLLFKRISFYLGGTLALALVIAFLLLAGLLLTNAGAKWTLQHVQTLTPVKITYVAVKGALWQGLEFKQLAVDASHLGVGSIQVDELSIAWQPLALLTGRVQVNSLSLRNINVIVAERSPATAPAPFVFPVMDLPLVLEVKRLRLRDLTITTGTDVEQFPDLDAQVFMGGQQILLSHLNVSYQSILYQLSARLRFDKVFSFKAKVASHGVDVVGQCARENAMQCTATLAWANFSHPLTGDIKSPNGRLLLSLTDTKLNVSGEGDIQWLNQQVPLDSHITVLGDMDFEKSSAHIDRLAGQFAQGDVQLKGDLNWDKEFKMDVAIDAQGLSLAHWLPDQLSESSANLNATLQLAVPPSGITLAIDVPRVELNFGGQNLTGKFNIHWDPSSFDLQDVALVGAGSRVQALARLKDDDVLSLQAQFDSSDLSALVPELAGTADLDLHVQGNISSPAVQLTFNGKHLRLSDWRADSLTMVADVNSQSAKKMTLADEIEAISIRKLSVNAKNLVNSTQTIGDVALALNGTSTQHHLTFSGSNLLSYFKVPVLSVAGAISLPRDEKNINALLAGAVWQVDLEQLEMLDGMHDKPWQLSAPSKGSLSAKGFEIEPLCLQQLPAFSCIDSLKFSQWQDLDFSGHLGGFYLDRSRNLFPEWFSHLPVGWKIRGELIGEWAVSAAVKAGAANTMKASARLQMLGGGMTYSVSDEPSLELPVEVFSVQMTGDEQRLALEGLAKIDEKQILTLSGGINHWQSPDRSFNARLGGEIGQLTYLQPFISEVREIQGKATIDLAMSLAAGALTPEYDGRLKIVDGAAFVPASGAQLHSWQLVLEAERGDLVLHGQGKVGEGLARIDGKVSTVANASGKYFQAQLGITGVDLELVDLPDLKLHANPDLMLTGGDNLWHLAGSINVHDSSLVLKELPASASSISEDARIYGVDQPEPEPSLMVLTGNVALKFDKNVTFEGFGLSTSVGGSLRFTRDADRTHQMHGVVKLTHGRYRSYGQKLDIDNGRIIFSGTMDDPTLDVLALRKIEEVTVGIRLYGTAKHPKSELYSDKVRSDADILSYIVSGKSLSQSSDSENVDMQTAALNMGLTQALPFLQRIGGELGLSDISVEETSSGASSIAAGKKLNDRLYIKYVYGILGAAGNFVVQYRLSDQLKLETSSGEFQAIDLTYSWDSKPPQPTAGHTNDDSDSEPQPSKDQ